jgi:uncharacterized surface protein with fasciclin (FAS1) repeats
MGVVGQDIRGAWAVAFGCRADALRYASPTAARVGYGVRMAVLSVSLSLLGVSCAGSNPSVVAPTTTASPTSLAPSSTRLSPPSSSGSATSTSVPRPTKSILELARAEGSLSTLLRLLDTAGLTSVLAGPGPFTLLAPTDAAFAKMDKTTLDRISQSPDALASLLRFHVIIKRLTKQDIAAGFVTTMEGSTLTLQATTSLPIVNGSKTIRGARATNGTILVIDSVLLPVDLKLP